MKKIEVKRIIPTTYEDGTSWMEYTVDGRYAYEVSEKFTDSSVELMQQEIDNRKDVSNLVDKIDINECYGFLSDIVEECRQSDNEMWDVAEDEVTVEEVEEIEKEIKELGLEGYINTWEYGSAITVYGGAITKFIF